MRPRKQNFSVIKPSTFRATYMTRKLSRKLNIQCESKFVKEKSYNVPSRLNQLESKPNYFLESILIQGDIHLIIINTCIGWGNEVIIIRKNIFSTQL